MQERKTEFRFFTVAEWEKEEASAPGGLAVYGNKTARPVRL